MAVTRRRRALSAIVAAVVAAHGLLLLGLPLWSQVKASRTEVAAMHTRSLSLPAPPAPQAEPSAAPPPPAQPRNPPAPKPRPRPQRPAPAPAPLDTPIRETIEPLYPSVPPSEAAAEAAGTESTGPAAGTGHAEAGTDAAANPATEAAAATPPASAEPAVAAVAAEGQAQGMEVIPAGGTPLPPGTAVPVQLPDPARLSFAVTGQAKRFNYSANAELLWTHANGLYQARQEVSLFLLGSRSQASEGRITTQGLEPGRFIDKGRKEQTAQLAFDRHLAHFSNGAPDAAIAPGAQDRLSVFLQLSALLAGAPNSYPPGTQIGFITVSARRADRWTFRVVGPETLDLPSGSMETVRLDRIQRPGDDQQASLWLAPSMQYLPVRIVLKQDNGDFADLQLKSRQAP